MAGIQVIDRTISAPALRVDYQYPQRAHMGRPTADGDFSLSPVLFGKPFTPEEADNRWRQRMKEPWALNWDPYAVRQAFEAVDSAEAARVFLSNSGRFWPMHEVLWSEFREWQQYFRWLRLSYEKALCDPEGAKAWRTADGFENTFFKERHAVPEDMRHEMPPDALRDHELSRRRMLLSLRRFAVHLPEDSGRISICWAEPGDKAFVNASPTKSLRGKLYKPFIRIETTSVLEAIAATIYVDRQHGLTHNTCKFCQKIFDVRSQHDREFCWPIREDLQTSQCKNAYFAKKKRDRERDAKAKIKASKKGRPGAVI